MSASEKTIRLTIDLTYSPETWHGDDPEAIEWFQSILNGDDLQLGEFGEVGDMIGTVKVVDCDPTKDERVKALVDAAKPYISPVQNADYSRQLRQHDALVAALRDMEGGK